MQAQILALLERLNRERGLATILITHDLGIVAEVADRVRSCTRAGWSRRARLDEIFYDPQHPYTWGLLGSLTRIDRPRPRRLPQIPGAPPSLLELDGGCAFRARCPHAHERCAAMPGLEARAEGNAGAPRPLLARAGAQAGAAPGRGPDRAGGAGVSDAQRRARRCSR